MSMVYTNTYRWFLMEKGLLPEYDEWKKSRPKPDRSKYMKERYQKIKAEELKKSLANKRTPV